MKTIQKTLSNFTSVSLEETKNVKLMNRIDSKFVFHFDQLNDLLQEAHENYYILKINDSTVMEYNTTYFDTKDWQMFTSHQNNKLNRHKIRNRKYLVSNSNHLEIKFKNNKKKTSKKRIKCDDNTELSTLREKSFIGERSPYCAENIEVKLKNSFNRIMLIHKYDKERITIDSNIEFSCPDNNKKAFNDLTILEIKREHKTNNSDFYKILKNKNIHELRLSKYMLGSISLYPKLKSNNYKPKLLAINKILKNSNSINKLY